MSPRGLAGLISLKSIFKAVRLYEGVLSPALPTDEAQRKREKRSSVGMDGWMANTRLELTRKYPGRVEFSSAVCGGPGERAGGGLRRR